jgi:hypothetical protein
MAKPIMSFTVTTRKRGGFEYQSVAETESAALVLARMMRRAGDEWCDEAKVVVRNGGGDVVAAWRGSGYGWQPLPLSRHGIDTSAGAHPLRKRAAQSLFTNMPTEPPQSQVSLSQVTEHSAV